MDNRIVVLLKSKRTGNRFYALVPPDSGFHNADAIEDFPADMVLGIAYPCLEDGLNDFAVIRTTFETIDLFPDDEELRSELFAIIEDARNKIDLRLTELRDRIGSGQAHFLGTDLLEFRGYVLHLVDRGVIRRTLDNMMKLDVFDTVARAEVAESSAPPEPVFRYEFLEEVWNPGVRQLQPRDFIRLLFDDVLRSAHLEENYQSRFTFDRNVFQKFIAVMFVNYATTDPSFYGTDREDYGVSSTKDMNETPLYRAVGAALRDIEAGRDFRLEGDRKPFIASAPAGTLPPVPPTLGAPPAPAGEEPEDLSHLFETDALDDLDSLDRFSGSREVEIEFGAAERHLLPPLTRIVDACRLLGRDTDGRNQEIRSLLLAAGREMFQRLQGLNIISPLSRNPFDDL